MSRRRNTKYYHKCPDEEQILAPSDHATSVIGSNRTRKIIPAVIVDRIRKQIEFEQQHGPVRILMKDGVALDIPQKGS